ncbi:MAG: 2-hydroxyhepta-2,4-diene-1,7-dioate isomerase [Pelagibacterium sp. SCN 64-44]|nr:MAG: 2-hydroxyhepta-2,4-diene-1,7-dioate isomerase [Pelagibacterium sp. SCN 64-44]
MKICRFNENRLGLVEGDEILDVTSVADSLPPVHWPLPRGDMLIENLERLRPAFEAAKVTAQRHAVVDVELLSPVANPGKIIAAPVNYKLHLDESRADEGIHFGSHVKTIEECGVFLKATSSLVGPSEGVVISMPERRTDHEIELAVVIGRRGRNISEADALDYVAGYAIGLDITIRGPEERSYRKSLDTFSVLGPWLVTADEFGNPSNADFEIKINGESRQKANTRDLIFDARKLIAYAAQAYTLEPGDIIMTGTPEGVSSIFPGDVMKCWMDRIGTMDVKIRGNEG